MENVKVAVIGIGNMGSEHAQNLFEGNIPGAELKAVCDADSERLEMASEIFGHKIKKYNSPEKLFEDREIDAVVIAVPHYDHPILAIEAFKKGLHVLIEKPAGVYTKKVREMNHVAEKSGKVFAIMYNQRTNPVYRKVKELIEEGELGEIRRTNWIITNWYRCQSYYDSGAWRASWRGEGGGVLLNQSPHQLDLWQWICGMPSRVRAFCDFGKMHDIEVEDDVTAYVQYDNGATGVFITSTSDSPGTNRLEITGDRGKIVVENNKLTFWRLRVSERQFNREYKEGFGDPECWKCEIPVEDEVSQHVGILTNWIESIQNGTPLIAPGIEGINGLTLSNAMHLSTWLDNWVDLPINEDLYYEKLKEKIKNSNYKKVSKKVTLDVSGTF